MLEVKGGENVNISVVRQLRGVLEHEDADMVGLILMHKLKPRRKATFSREMAMAGDMKDKRYPRLHLLSVPDILEGCRFELPNEPAACGSKQTQLSLPTEGSPSP
ncbi:MAG: hypothetical protein M2R45_03488 [Verrucomicrobia subdivision 3 bacterium]|nr:hypothetical protein [Limisphaerales bacterium]MCS1416660.1 hypothetical protein [Limisphaerales bacterium]